MDSKDGIVTREGIRAVKTGEPQILWGLELDVQEQKQILSGAGPAFELKNVPADELSEIMELSRSRPPAVTWIPLRLWAILPQRVRKALGMWDQTQRVLIRDDTRTALTLEDVIEQGFLTVVDKPLTKAKVRGALIKASEVTGLYDDICRMTEEIMLERELLRRKNAQLEFLSAILSEVADCTDAADILARAEIVLKGYLPLQALGAIFLGQAVEGGPGVEAEIHLPRKLTKPAGYEWTSVLLQAGAAVADAPVSGFRVREVAGPVPSRPRSLKPSRGVLSRMPLKAGADYFGCLALLTRGRGGLAKDDVRTLHAGINHLALALKNALVFGRITTRADYDALTRLHCRRFLDERLREVAARHCRYGLPLSMLAMEIDYFGKITDFHGVETGNAVLEEAAALVAKGLRLSDVSARYGDASFAALLPGTKLDQALASAERIRAMVEKAVARRGMKVVDFTMSIGAAGLDPETPDPAADLETRALAALAEAKNQGSAVLAG